jgi:hypothetical protein
MAFYCLNMLAMAIELAVHDPAYEDVASKFFEHFVAIADAMNTFNGTGLWDEADGFYYDQMHVHTTGTTTPLRVRSMVGLIPLIAVEVLHCDVIERLSGFSRRLRWFLENRPDLARHIAYLEEYDFGPDAHRQRLLAIPSRDRLRRVLSRLLDENEFLSPYGIRSLSRDHAEHPYVLTFGSQEYRVEYSPAESPTPLFGGNSNWRGPVWFPLNYLIIEALERYHHFYGDSLRVEYPTGAGNALTLGQIAHHLAARLAALFLPDETGRRPYQGAGSPSAQVPHGSDPILFHEYFNGDTGQGLGASHQTGWTALVVDWLQDVARARAGT